MPAEIYRYVFAAQVPLEDVEAALVLAVFGAGALHGEAAVLLDADHHLDAQRRICIIDASTPTGQDFNKLFMGYLRREVDVDAFSVQRLQKGAVLAPSSN